MGYSVDDYVTLNFFDAEVDANGMDMSWNIPQSYYSNRRAICTVEVICGTVTSSKTIGTDGVIISYVNGGQNSFTSGNFPPVIATGQKQTEFFNAKGDEFHSLKGGIKLLTNPRPNRITLRVENPQRGDIGTSPTMVICLKFCYYNQADTGEALHATYAPLLK